MRFVSILVALFGLIVTAAAIKDMIPTLTESTTLTIISCGPSATNCAGSAGVIVIDTFTTTECSTTSIPTPPSVISVSTTSSTPIHLTDTTSMSSSTVPTESTSYVATTSGTSSFTTVTASPQFPNSSPTSANSSVTETTTSTGSLSNSETSSTIHITPTASAPKQTSASDGKRVAVSGVFLGSVTLVAVMFG
ncbi:uncharacterized protein LY89DRAFT_674360 [Mollisia scopiformis]|uniref:Uncharacterized protein n=1 Tax=Mollisia scopiformis TaxID=149040 RepID=A0A194WSS8_MOLSC|nr:uncharacterized protein LY89DRAFT_674360 [Mollisia scopiformis]KUJ11001.1 hypothetical protein LY89DRAFT_674360 [Mollisia scopiformis]